MTDEFVDRLLIDTLKFWIKKIKRGDCTREQELAILNAMNENGDVYASIDELAEFYGKSKDAVYGIIKRRYPGKPKRNVSLYSFAKFRRCLPPGWCRKTNSETSG